MFLKGREGGWERDLPKVTQAVVAEPDPTGLCREAGTLAAQGAAHLLSALPALVDAFPQVRLALSIAQKVSLIPDPKASAVPQQGPGVLPWSVM